MDGGGDDRSDAGSAAPLGSPGEEVSCGGRGVRFRGAGGGGCGSSPSFIRRLTRASLGEMGCFPPPCPPEMFILRTFWLLRLGIV